MIRCIEHKIPCSCSHYSIFKLEGIDDIKKVFPEGECDELNWFVASTSGVHGTYCNLDDIEKRWDEVDEESGNPNRELTVQIIMPRMVRIIYGVIELENKEDITYLRKLINSSLEAMRKSQEGNL